MQQHEATTAISNRFLTLWPALATAIVGGGIPLVMDNTIGDINATGYLAEVVIEHYSSSQHTLGKAGNRKFRHEAWVHVRISGPVNVGRLIVDQLCGAVRAVIDSVRFGNAGAEEGITTFATTPAEKVKDPESGQLWIVVCTTPFEYYELR